MIRFSDIQLLRGGKPLLDHTSAIIAPGDKVGLVGKNGCGKSSLFALLRHQLSLDAGHYDYPNQWQVAWVAQETPALDKSALEYVIDGDTEYRELQDALRNAEAKDDGNAVALLHDKLDAIGGYTIEARAASLLDGLGFSQTQIHWSLTQSLGAGACDLTWHKLCYVAQIYCYSTSPPTTSI